ncbi:tRNA 2'-phosphotransferase 1 isoform X2 [Mesocricetus auratus]|uniref:2'-phosphotransferase n=1 Tax=Mesocricetus auratus TaxID=10036 RepID=A0ABM2XNZ9_MESAU|nr:tRNA 2'-phosphotransferase 1 isoform X2 [Mesocricetus auratus]
MGRVAKRPCSLQVLAMNAPGGRRQEGRRAHRPREQDRDVQLSKALSYALRHGALKLGLPMRADGFVPLRALLQLPQFHSFSVEDVQHVVDTNGKQRFALQPGEPSTGPLIRANQGHSLQVPELELMPLETPQALPLMLVHGTFWKHWPSILLKGLSCRGRAHIHLASGLPGDPGVISGQCHLHLFYPPRFPTKGHSFLCVRPLHRFAWSNISPPHHRAPFCPGTPGPSLAVPTGMRPNCEVVVFIDGPLALSDGIPFFRSANGVILTPGNAEGFLLPKYFKEALQLRPTRKPLSLAGDKEMEGQSIPEHSSRGGRRKIQQ